jgi:integrase
MSNAKQLEFSDLSILAGDLPVAERLCSLPPQQQSEIVRLGALVDRFVEYSRTRKRPTTITAYEKWRRGAARVGQIDGVAVLEQDTRLATPGWCQKVHDAVSERSGPAQADNVAKLLQAAWQHAEERGEPLRLNPWKSVKRNGSKPPPIAFPRTWTLDFLNMLDDAPRDGVLPQQIADMLTCAQLLGGRMWCEIRSMRWTDLREDEGLIVFPWSKEEIRAVPIELLGARGWQAIERQRGKSDEWIWAGQRGGPIGETTAAKWWPAVREYAAERGLMFTTLEGKPLVIHHLRHAFTDYCMSVLKLPKQDVQQLLGHRDERSTRRYTHGNADHLREPARRVAAILGGRTVVAANKKPGLSKDRVALAIKHIGGTRNVAETDEHVAERISQVQGVEAVKARAVAGWRQRQRTPSDEVVDLLARWIASSVGWSEPAALGWLFGYGDDELPEPPRLRVVG